MNMLTKAAKRRGPSGLNSRMRELAEDALACRSCGVAVRKPDPARAEVVRLQAPLSLAAANRGVPAGWSEVPVTRCDECATRRAQAEALLAAHPRVARAHGQVGVDRLDAALAALDMRGFRGGKMIAALTKTDDDVMRLIEDLAPLGAAATWSAGYATTGASEAKRWGHVREQLAKEIREAHTTLVHRSLELPTPFAPPSGSRGCLFCGVGTLRVRESEVPTAWGSAVRVQPGTLGGQPQPALVSGHLCPACRAATELVGAPGMPAVEGALLAHLGFRVRLGYILNWPSSARAWIALPNAEPNKVPWEHVATERMAATLATLEQKMYVRREVRR